MVQLPGRVQIAEASPVTLLRPLEFRIHNTQRLPLSLSEAIRTAGRVCGGWRCRWNRRRISGRPRAGRSFGDLLRDGHRHRSRPFRSGGGNGDANHVEQVDQHVGFDLVVDGRLGTKRGIEVDLQQPRSASAIEHHIEPKDLEALRVVLAIGRRGKKVGERPAHDVLNTDGGLNDDVIDGAPNLPGTRHP
eukprot:scaffold12461_cov67-Phaeocystis_antarctica.AAC.12